MLWWRDPVKLNLWLEPLEPLDLLDHQDHQDLQELQEPVHQELMGEQGLLVHQVIQAHKELWDPLGLPVHKVELVQQDHWEQVDLLGLQAQQVFLDQLVEQANPVSQAHLDLKEPRVVQELLVSLELQVRLEEQVQ
jgi:hypothetical protein